MSHKKLSLVFITTFCFSRFIFGATWEGLDNFSSGISTNWTVQQSNQGSMTVQATSGHASFLVAPSTNTEQNAYLFWKGTPALNQDWTVQTSGHNAANWSNDGASQLQLMASDLVAGEAFVIESYRGNDGIGIVTSMWQDNGVTTTTRQYVLATNTDFNLRLVYSAATGNIYAWYNLTGSWVLLDTFNIASFPTALQPSDTFTFGLIADTYYGPVTEGQIYADNFTLINAISPFIINQPVGQSVPVGSPVTFNVGANGTAPLSYQWRFNATNSILNATNSSLTLTNVQLTNAGDYDVVITNAYGSVISSVANFQVITYPPQITNQPAAQAVALGSNAVFSVGASGTAPLSYQWRFNTNNYIVNATNSSLTVVSAQLTNVGNYDVIITNAYGAVTSSIANLFVVTNSSFALFQGLIAYYPFNGNANDASGYGHNASLNSGTTIVPDRFGNLNSACRFQNASLLFTNLPVNLAGPYSFGIWIKLNGYDNGNAIGELTDTVFDCNSNPQIYQILNSVTYSHCGSGSTDALPFSDADSLIARWHQLFVSVASNGQTLVFRDGVPTTNTLVAFWPTTTLANLTLGAAGNSSGSGQYSRVDLDEVRIYNRALSATEAAQLYALESRTLSANLNAGTNLNLTMTCLPGQSNILQTTTNLAPPVQWQSIHTNTTDTNGLLQFIETNLNNARKFYRVTTP